MHWEGFELMSERDEDSCWAFNLEGDLIIGKHLGSGWRAQSNKMCGERGLGAQGLCYLYTNAQSLGNRQEKLKFVIQTEGNNLIGITETWWDNSHDLSMAVEKYELLKKDHKW